jgi:hypothetical protein
MVEQDFRERDQQARAAFAERLARLRASLARRRSEARPGMASRPPATPRPSTPGDEPTWWWQKD